ncbi:MAG: hypothetical protein KBS74_01260 [Clostridiales bacterium]|nr:hypothetical protein [Candidatus Cacconaster stercorequi]
MDNAIMTKDEKDLLFSYRSLNAEGREKILTYAKDMVYTGSYKKTIISFYGAKRSSR